MEYRFECPPDRSKPRRGRPRKTPWEMSRAEYQKRWRLMKVYGSLERLDPNFVKPKQIRKKRGEYMPTVKRKIAELKNIFPRVCR